MVARCFLKNYYQSLRNKDSLALSDKNVDFKADFNVGFTLSMGIYFVVMNGRSTHGRQQSCCRQVWTETLVTTNIFMTTTFVDVVITVHISSWTSSTVAGASMTGGMYDREHVWQGTCVAGRHAWWGCSWQGVCMAGRCVAGDVGGRRDDHYSGRHASYWNAFFFLSAIGP